MMALRHPWAWEEKPEILLDFNVCEDAKYWAVLT